MLSSSKSSFSRNLPLGVFNQLGELLQQMARSIENSSLVLTEAVLARVNTIDNPAEKFTLLISEKFSALLVGVGEEIAKDTSVAFLYCNLDEQSTETIQASLTFNHEAIASFILNLRSRFQPDSGIYQNLSRFLQILQPNDAILQTQFSLSLLEILSPQQNQQTNLQDSSYPTVSVCQPVENALKKQIAQERLLNQITTQIRKSTEVGVILATAVEQIRNFLELDRLVIYRLEEINSTGETQCNTQAENDLNSRDSQLDLLENWQECTGCVVYEARANNKIPSALTYKEENCFVLNYACREKYRQGFTLVVDDVSLTFASEDCLLHLFTELKVRAIIASPIVYEDKLWGLLIAHQCHAIRHWTDNEKNFLTQIAEQLAIAIHQAELMRSLTLEKQHLEQRVEERTLALRDALIAAQAGSRLRNEFLATISHELLTPLTYVIGMSSTLLSAPLGELSQRQRHYLQRIHDSGEHLLEMINDILDLSQIEAGKAVLNITEFSLTSLASNKLQSLADKAQTQEVELKLDLQIDPKRDRFTADIQRTEQILNNLLTNAIKFTPKGGNVTLRLWVENDTAVFQVEDTGIGIPEEQLPLLFEKFQQLDTPYRRSYEGTGLGLALTKQLVELHRGRIEVESAVDVGSIFTVWIPMQIKN